MEAVEFITFEDIVRAGNCAEEVLEFAKENNTFFGNVDELIREFPDEKERILSATNRDGSGDGSGSGYGSGYGYGSGDGSGSGYGDGSG